MQNFRGAILILCACFASADQLTLGAGVTLLTDSISQLQLGGSGRSAGEAFGKRIAIESLLKTVTSEKLDDASKALLQQVSELLVQLLADLTTARNGIQTAVDGINAVLDACEISTHVTEDSTLETTQTGAATNHETCRTDEGPLHTTKATDCAAANDFLGQAPPTCSTPEVDTSTDGLEAWRVKLDGAHSWFSVHASEWAGLASDCAAATSALADKITECNGLQISYESAICNWVDYRRSRCETQALCYNTAKNNHDSFVATETPIANQREEDAKMVTYVKCLVDELIGGATDPAVWEPACADKKAADYGSYNNAWPTLNSMAACADVSVYPGHDNWEASAYSTWAGTDVVVPDLAVSCAPPS